ncbi:MAG: hypothetical protein A2868_02360 [Candidatus Levybacteria bacterium RIFCSPHIGHO2_01_FULL_40_15b]|nr:MAG: hypothetical protein A2868_02360 [Candidatus Levybacteria bacterium RIFCSPHIGHO2_01_FULL_40_15b]
MEQTVVRIGNSVGIIIPQQIRKSTGINAGDKVLVEEKNKKIGIYPIKKAVGGVNAKFMKMVNEFMEEHRDVLQALANR